MIDVLSNLWTLATDAHMLRVYYWFLGGFVAVYVLVYLVSRSNKVLAKESIEERIYRWTLSFLWLHLLAGLILSSWEYRQWSVERSAGVPFWDCWPMALVYLVCFMIGLLLIFVVFGSRYRFYARPVVA